MGWGKWTTPLLLAVALWGQDQTDRVTVPFSDPSGPKRLTCGLIHGSITVKAHTGRDVVVEAQGKGAGRGRREPPAGMRRLNTTATGLVVEESGNQVKVSAGHGQRVELTILVPVETDVKVSTVNSGNLWVEGVSGEVDANNLNGNITVKDVSGAVVAHTLNGKLIASLNRIAAEKAMSFSTLNGDVDVTLPADAKATLKMKSENGDVFTDFEVTLKGSPVPPTTGQRDSRGRYRVRFDKSMYGAINGGGPEFSFTSLNGTIYIRKAK